MQYIVALSAALVLNAVANLCMKMGMKGVEAGGGLLAGGAVGAVRTVLTTPVLLGGLICFGLNAFLYMFALQSKTLKISLAYPLMVGGGYAIIALVAALAPNLRERLTAGQWVGVGLIMVGVIVVATLTPAEG
jgi:multidrug transporter EmrE-like cation transporter